MESCRRIGPFRAEMTLPRQIVWPMVRPDFLYAAKA